MHLFEWFEWIRVKRRTNPMEPFESNRIHLCSNSIRVQSNRIEFELFDSKRKERQKMGGTSILAGSPNSPYITPLHHLFLSFTSFFTVLPFSCPILQSTRYVTLHHRALAALRARMSRFLSSFHVILILPVRFLPCSSRKTI